MRRYDSLRFLFMACCLAAVCGCVKIKQTIVVKPDGSGSIVFSQALTPEMLAMIEQSRAGMKEMGTDGKDLDPLNEMFFKDEQLRKAAEKFGEDVEFVKAEKLDKDGMKGVVALYSFKDVNKVKLNMQQNMMPEGADLGRSDTDQGIRFSFVKGTPNRLTVTMPVREKPAAAAEEPSDKPESPVSEAAAATQQAQDVMMKMFRGMEVSIAVQVKGTVVKTNARRAGAAENRFTLLQMNMDELMANPSFKELTRKAESSSGPGDALGLFLDLPGVLIETNRPVFVEFN
jgi:hypothetical protein